MGVDIHLPDSPDWGHPHLVHFEEAHLLFRDAGLGDLTTGARGRLCYLATPYSKVCVDQDGAWDCQQSLACGMRAAEWARIMAVEGITAISPIIQAVEMLSVGLDYSVDPLDATFWSAWCQPLLSACDAMIVPPIEGWQESLGIWQEVVFALRNNRPVFLIAPRKNWGAR